MPSLSDLQDFVTEQIGTFVHGKWDYIGLAQLYPTLEVLAQLVPRKQAMSNYELTISYQTQTETSGHGARPGDPISPVQKRNALKRKIKPVKYVDSIGWTKDQDTLQGKSNEHIVKTIQKDLLDFDLHWWQDLEHMMLQKPVNITPADDETLYGFPAWITASSGQTALFELKGGDDPYGAGRPGSISITDHPGYTNPTGVFQTVSDDNFFKMLELFFLQRKLLGAVPNPRLLPDTPNDVIYVQVPLHTAITSYLQASNENTGLDAGRYRGNPTYKGAPFVVWHALGHPDSPVRISTCAGFIIDWNSFEYHVVPEFDRHIDGPKDLPLVPSGLYMTSEVWHQVGCQRPDRNLRFDSSTANLAP